jgi:transposase
MIEMRLKQEIILKYFRAGMSLRRISRETGVSRPTVTKYVKAYQAGIAKSEDETILKQSIAEPPKYRKRSTKKRKLKKEIRDLINQLLEVNKQHRKTGLSKQQLKKIDILEHVREAGFDIGYTTVCGYINRQLEKSKEAFVKQEYKPGSECEFDWGTVRLITNGKQQDFQLAIFTSAYSNYHFAQLYPKQNTLCFQEAHAKFFEQAGCVFETMVYDNMKVALRKVVGNSEKEATEGLLQLSMFYLFNYRFCNYYKGNEKGHVERAVELIRRKAFSLKTSFKDISEANRHLEDVVSQLNKKVRENQRKSPYELFLEEKKVLPKSPQKFCSSEKTSGRVDKFSTVSYKNNHYSVPDKFTGKMVDLRIFSDRIKIYDGLTFLCEHPRKFGRNEWSLNLNHYLKTLLRKPGALKNSLALSQGSEELKTIYQNHFLEDSKDFVKLLQYMKESKKKVAEIQKIIEDLQKISPKGISLDKIKMLAEQKVEVHKPSQNDKILEYSLKQISEIKKNFRSNVYKSGDSE